MAYRCPPRPPYRCPVPKRRPGGTIPAPEAAPGKYPQQSTITGFTPAVGGGGIYTWPRSNTSVSLEAVTISDMINGVVATVTLTITDGGGVVRYVASSGPVPDFALNGTYTFAPANISSLVYYPGTNPFTGSFIQNIALPNEVVVPANGLVTVTVSDVDFSAVGNAGTAVMVFRDSRASTL